MNKTRIQKTLTQKLTLFITITLLSILFVSVIAHTAHAESEREHERETGEHEYANDDVSFWNLRDDFDSDNRHQIPSTQNTTTNHTTNSITNNTTNTTVATKSQTNNAPMNNAANNNMPNNNVQNNNVQNNAQNSLQDINSNAPNQPDIQNAPTYNAPYAAPKESFIAKVLTWLGFRR